jgi:cytochrome c biogenesis protein CcdA
VIAAIGPDGSLAVYLALGMVATVNPCGFAMLPAYLSYFLGLDETGDGSGGDGAGSGGDGVVAAGARTARALRVALAVSAGFLAVFALAGAVVELTSVPVYENMPWLSIVIGVALAALGVAMLAGHEVMVRLPKLERGGRHRTTRSMALFGVSYAVASIGCTLPTFLGAVAGTISRESVVDGLVVFAVYALGMSVVLMALTVAMALARTSLVRFLRRAQPHVNRVAGGLVALAGAYVAYYGWLELRTYGGAGAVPTSGATDTVTGWSYDITGWVSRTGAVRIATVLALGLAAVVVVSRRLPGRAPADAAANGGGGDDGPPERAPVSGGQGTR